jgi:hypothetical protein
MRRYLGLAILASVLVTGCADKHWTKPGATAEDFVRDSDACALEARRGVFTAPPVDKRKYRSCMMARGYARVEGGKWLGVRD